MQTFLCADDPALPAEQRRALAGQQLRIRNVAESLPAEALLRQSDAFRQFAGARFAPARWLPRFPAEGRQGKRYLRMEADLLLENPDAVHALFFAGFAEGMKKWKAQAQALAPVAGWMSRVLPQAFPGKKIQYWIVFAVEGQLVEVII